MTRHPDRVPFTPDGLRRHPNPLAPHYSRFRVSERLLLTGHSHQAWPDCGLVGQEQAWLDAAEHVDAKWERAFERADRVRAGFARLLGDETGPDDSGYIALGQNTHELVTRFLSALPLGKRPRLITTDGEFHTLRRQLDRLAEEGIEIVKVSAAPAASAAERLAAAVTERTAAVLASAVFFNSGQIAPGLATVLDACQRFGVELLVDAYHALNVIPFSLRREELEGAFVTGGGYKYCQLGEGVCFLRFPKSCTLRPVLTGWFSEFDAIAEARGDGAVPYGRGAGRFAGATYDPTSHYRAAEVFDFFAAMKLTPALLRQVSRNQIALLARLFDELDLDPALLDRDRSVPLEGVAGFLTLRCPRAAEVSARLAERGVSTDFRGEALRLGPAPYLSDRQLEDAMARLGDTAREET